VPPAAPTLRAQERPEKSDAPHKAAVETARAVSHSGTPARPRRRVSLLVLLAVLGVGSVVAAVAAMTMRARDESSPRFSASAPAAETISATSLPAGTAVDTAVGPAPSTTPSPPDAESAALASDAARPVRSRTAPKQEREAPVANAAPSSPPVAPSASAEAPTGTSARPGATPNCTPPYYYDSKMNRIFKKECL
jgi:cytoskeletal protein RodZ